MHQAFLLPNVQLNVAAHCAAACAGKVLLLPRISSGRGRPCNVQPTQQETHASVFLKQTDAQCLAASTLAINSPPFPVREKHSVVKVNWPVLRGL